jgi:hypothetical protein
MDFYRKYELSDPLSGEGTRSFRAKQISTGREVSVHLLVGGKTPGNEALLARLRGLPPQSMGKLIEVGDHEGTTFVVTAAPPFQHLNEWLDDQDRAASEAARKLTRVGVWKVPTFPKAGASEPAPPPPLAPETPAPRASEPGEFTRMFQAPAPQATQSFEAARPAPEPAPAPPAPPDSAPPPISSTRDPSCSPRTTKGASSVTQKSVNRAE